jgi:ribonuclease D
MQFATDGGQTTLVDPLAVDLSPLRRLFASDALAVLHAAQQDLDVLTHSCGAVPSRLYDTQLASGFLGYSTPSLVSLLMAELKVTTAKGDRLTDWLRRPLSSEQLVYAASDVDHLLALADLLDAQIAELGRSQWVAEACEELRLRPVSGTDPSQAWLRIKDVRMLKPRARGVARAVSEWRERRAMSVDVPVRQILPDLAVLGIAQRQPKTTHDLVQARGVEERHSKGNLGKEILDAVADGQRNDIDLPAPDGEDLDRAMRPAVALVSAWMADLGRKQRVDTSLLATRADLVALLRGDDDARLLTGWRAQLVGDDIQRLVQGKAGLTFDGRGGLRLIDVAGPE